VHHAEDEEYDADLHRERLEEPPGVAHRVGSLEIQRHEPQVDEVEADHQQVVDGLGEFFVAPQDIGEEDAAVGAQRPGDPHRESDADDEVDDVGDDCEIHGPTFVRTLLERVQLSLRDSP
jgi:hypothetical protein